MTEAGGGIYFRKKRHRPLADEKRKEFGYGPDISKQKTLGVINHRRKKGSTHQGKTRKMKKTRDFIVESDKRKKKQPLRKKAKANGYLALYQE